MSDWTPPKGYVLTRHEGHNVNTQGFAITAESVGAQREIMPDGQMDVFWYDEAEPFAYSENDGTGPNASQAAKDAAAAGKPLGGFNPKGSYKPIQGGFVPPQYQLHIESEAPSNE